MRTVDLVKGEDTLKAGKWYVFSRIYCLVIILLWNSLLYWEFRPGGTHSAYYIFFMLPLALPALSMLASLLAFPWRYSAFGRYQRTMPPREPPLAIGRFAGIRIGWLQTPYAITLYSSGLGLSIVGVGKTFIPFEYISHIEKGILGRCSLYHCWPEVRSPIKFSNKTIYDGLIQ